MPHLKRLVPLALTVLLSACIELPEIAEPEPAPDAGGTPDAGYQPDSGVPADNTPPTITGAAPAHSSTNVSTSPQLLFTFSEAMDVSTVQFSIAPTVILTAPEWSNGNTQLSLQPVAPLAQNTTYTLVIDGKDTAGNVLSDRKVFSFTTTGPAPDTTPPTVLDAIPSHGAIGVARDAPIIVVFSEPMDKASAQTAFAITSPLGLNSGVFDWNAAGTEMTFKPDTNLPYGTEITWRVSTAATDLSNNPLEANVTATFRSIRLNTALIDFDPQTSGATSAPDYQRYNHYYNFEAVGDGSLNDQYRLLLGFKLDALPEDLKLITHCKLRWHVSGQRGTPFVDLGRLFLEHVYIGEEIALSTTEWTNPAAKEQYESSALSAAIIVPSDIASTSGNLDVTSLVSFDWLDRANRGTKRSQFRLRFETISDTDGSHDSLYSDIEQTPKLAELEVTYEHP